MPAETVREKALLEKPRLTREQIAGRAALELPDGAYVNLGWGIPNLIANYLPGEITVYFHSENGILGMGRRAKPGEEDYDLVDAMKIPRSEEHTSELQSQSNLVCRLLLEKKKKQRIIHIPCSIDTNTYIVCNK